MIKVINKLFCLLSKTKHFKEKYFNYVNDRLKILLQSIKPKENNLHEFAVVDKTKQNFY